MWSCSASEPLSKSMSNEISKIKKHCSLVSKSKTIVSVQVGFDEAMFLLQGSFCKVPFARLLLQGCFCNVLSLFVIMQMSCSNAACNAKLIAKECNISLVFFVFLFAMLLFQGSFFKVPFSRFLLQGSFCKVPVARFLLQGACVIIYFANIMFKQRC